MKKHVSERVKLKAGASLVDGFAAIINLILLKLQNFSSFYTQSLVGRFPSLQFWFFSLYNKIIVIVRFLVFFFFERWTDRTKKKSQSHFKCTEKNCFSWDSLEIKRFTCGEFRPFKWLVGRTLSFFNFCVFDFSFDCTYFRYNDALCIFWIV